MKYINRICTASLIMALVFFSSCKDDEPTLSKLELLTQKPWKLKSIAIVGFPAATPESTQADDTYTFNKDGSYIFDEGGSKEDPSDPQTVNGTWAFAENETLIKLSLGGLTLNQEILELNSNTLKVKFTLLFEIEETFGH